MRYELPHSINASMLHNAFQVTSPKESLNHVFPPSYARTSKFIDVSLSLFHLHPVHYGVDTIVQLLKFLFGDEEKYNVPGESSAHSHLIIIVL